MAKKSKTSGLTPGTITPISGQYELVGPRGGRTGAEVASVKGSPLPPVGKGETYRLLTAFAKP